mmetsp:Transcript_162/g.576  ORF Transcript_162/g.576 Transcript_162/m.576 type:complete len:106 (+) Transcript_162:400-717(+)
MVLIARLLHKNGMFVGILGSGCDDQEGGHRVQLFERHIHNLENIIGLMLKAPYVRPSILLQITNMKGHHQSSNNNNNHNSLHRGGQHNPRESPRGFTRTHAPMSQ